MAIKTKFDHQCGRYIDCDSAKIYIEEIGNPDLPVLFMLHGGFGDMEDFNSITPAFARYFRIVGIDSRGHGKSTLGTTTLSYKLLTDDFAQVISTLQPEEFHVLGFSDGGTIAYRYALRSDPCLQKILTVGASWKMGTSDPSWELLSGMTGDLWKQMFPASYESYMRLNPEPDFDCFSKAVISMWLDLGTDGYPGDLMDQVTTSILAVRGDKDILTSQENQIRLQEIARNTCTVTIPFAEHVAFADNTEVFQNEAGSFFGVEL